ncbi:hypothetical protein TRFO_41200 [Tritrichomonas foetus]|uniref:Protein kinase domain-containing protein n=1 Tax=Tritrichomonas foetus TaxID=1144522 RepID=A0A1J4L108_9EUKA|nr:hypothetical protein TRFO_41200 [Tritrichomonas foetus]|eukprot:OHT17201.1 hypothetical protein TRFO_41200 [Tritrichomonas foetus]
MKIIFPRFPDILQKKLIEVTQTHQAFGLIYSSFNYNFIDFFDGYYQSNLKNLIYSYPFITLGYTEIQEENIECFILCFEKGCIFIKNNEKNDDKIKTQGNLTEENSSQAKQSKETGNSLFYRFIQDYLNMKSTKIYDFDLPNEIKEKMNLQNLNSSKNNVSSDNNCIDSENNAIEQQIKSFYFHFFNFMKQNYFLRSSFKPLLIYLIKRFYYHPKHFKDQSFLHSFDHLNYSEFNEKDFLELRLIGKGSTANVFECLHLKTLFIVAIKKFNQNCSDKSSEREENFAKRVECSYFINKCYGFIINRQTHQKSYIYEYMCNGTLKTNINSMKPSDNSIIIIRILFALHKIHECGLVYRDLKPDNILFNSKNEAFLADFGSSRFLIDDEFTSDLGSIHYSSPESMTKNYEITQLSDIYSFGLLIYFICHRKSFFENFSFSDIVNFHKNHKVPEFCNEDKENKTMFQHCVAISPMKRFSTLQLLYQFFLNHEYFPDSTVESIRMSFNILNNIKPLNKRITNVRIRFQNQDYEEGKKYYFMADNVLEAEKNNYIKAAKCCFKKAIQTKNHVDSKFFLGKIYILFNNNSISKISKGTSLIESAIQGGMFEGAIFLGDLFFEGIYVSKSISKCIFYYKLGFKGNYPQAAIKLGYAYYLEQNYEQSLLYFESEDITNPIDIYFVGYIYLKIVLNVEKMLYYFEKAANKNHSKAQYQLGKLYYEGYYVNKNIDIALNYFKMASTNNCSNAKYYLGLIYLDGNFMQRDITLAMNYFITLARNGNIKANYQLGLLYETGIHIEKNIPKAISYYIKSAQQLHYESIIKLFSIYITMNDYHKASEIIETILPDCSITINNCNDFSYNPFNSISNDKFIHLKTSRKHLYQLGEYYKIQILDVMKSFYYFYLSAKLDYKRGLFEVGLFFYEKNEFYLAIKYLELSSKSRYFKAIDYLVNIFIQKNDFKNTFLYHELGSTLKYPKSLYFIAYAYEKGIHYNKNIYKAIHFYQSILDLKVKKNTNTMFKYKASNRLGMIFSTMLKEIEFDKVIEIYNLIPENEIDGYSLNNKGILYYFYTNNKEYSKKCFKRSAKKDFLLGKINLKLLFENDNTDYISIKSLTNELNNYLKEKKNIKDTDSSWATTFLLYYYSLLQFQKTLYHNGNKNSSELLQSHIQNIVSIFKEIKIIYSLLKAQSCSNENFEHVLQPVNYDESENILKALDFDSQNGNFNELLEKWNSIKKHFEKIENTVSFIHSCLYRPPYSYFFGVCYKSCSQTIILSENLSADFYKGFES